MRMLRGNGSRGIPALARSVYLPRKLLLCLTDVFFKFSSYFNGHYFLATVSHNLLD